MRKFVAALLIGSAMTTMAVSAEAQHRPRGGQSSQSDDNGGGSSGGGFARAERAGWGSRDSSMSERSVDDSGPRRQRDMTREPAMAPTPSAEPRHRRTEGRDEGRAEGGLTQMAAPAAEAPRRHRREAEAAAASAAPRADFEQKLRDYRARHGENASPRLPEAIATKRWGSGRTLSAAPNGGTIQQTVLTPDRPIKQMLVDVERTRRAREYYRQQNWWLYRLGNYYDPYGYSYRSWQPGFTMWPSYYSQDYWLDDPMMWQLPRVYGPYRWVRYWDDAILVNMYTGQVVTVMPNFFW